MGLAALRFQVLDFVPRAPHQLLELLLQLLPGLVQAVRKLHQRVAERLGNRALLLVLPAVRAAVFQHNAVPLPRAAHRLLPGNIDFFLRVFPNPPQQRAVAAHPQNLCAHGIGVFLNQQPGVPVLDALRGAASAHQQARAAAGGRLPHDDTVRVKGGGEQEQIRQRKIAAQQLPVPNCAGHDAFRPKAGPLDVRRNLLPVRAVPNQQKAEFCALFPGARQRVQREFKPLIPHHPPHKQKDGLLLPDAVLRAQRRNRVRRGAPFLKIGAVFHHDIVALIPDTAQVFPRAVGDDPDFIARLNILQQKPDGNFAQHIARSQIFDVDVVFCVIGHHNRRPRAPAQRPRQHG